LESSTVQISVGVHESPKPNPDQMTVSQKACWLMGALALALFALGWVSGHGSTEHGEAAHHAPAIWSIIPFVTLLLAIAVLPLIPSTQHWWENNQNRLIVSVGLGAITLLYYLLSYGGSHVATLLDHAVLHEYVPFILLLFSLYVISGGISLRGDLAAHPGTNTAILAVGALIASFIGTTGASMLLIRPLLKTNSERHHVRHTVIFFIFLVSNIGGCLLPIGDPPLFLGYLRGVPFMWTLGLWPQWLMATAILLVVYFVWDSWAYRHEAKKDIARDERESQPLRLSGTLNFVWLFLVVVCVAVVKPGEPLPILGFVPFPFMREILMLGLAALSLKLTAPKIRSDNQFNYHAILEVAALFIGIFICMQAPMDILKASGESLSSLLSSPGRFFWATGGLSSFLDNAPTYLVFFQTGVTMTPPTATDVVQLAGGGTILATTLVAISVGSVFMGAMTYIGNGPNFMVKAIAEQSGVRMPSFFGYMVYSVVILIPIFILVTWVIEH
jgi:Na+/H+ antiporter NhaD/arsenite permease-like protein